MTTLMQNPLNEKSSISSRVGSGRPRVARYGLVVVVGWIGLMKFTTYEAEGIRPFVANSPLMSWVYGPLSVRGFSTMLGVGRGRRRAAHRCPPALASGFGLRWQHLAVGMFLTTLSFLVTTPGVWEPSLGGFPALARRVPGALPHQGPGPARISLWTLGEAWRVSEQRE